MHKIDGARLLHLSVSMFIGLQLVASLGVTSALANDDSPKVLVNPWPPIKTPTRGSPRIYGTYAAGCIAGAESLPLSGSGYEVMRPTRNRFFGHSSLIAILKRAALELSTINLPLLYGDLGQPRGGPMPPGSHASHQVGLDVDIWFRQLTPRERTNWNERMREQLSPRPVVKKDFKSIDQKNWRQDYESALFWLAAQPETARIFVNAAIKKHLCELDPYRLELMKIRPWFFHTDHLHLRFNCPAGESECVNQAPPTTLGCDSELEDWFAQDVLDKQIRPQPDRTPSPPPVLPKACDGVLAET